MIRVIELGGVEIPMLSSLEIKQTFASTARETILPMGDGSIIKQTLAGSENKIEINISSTGPVPPGLYGLDLTGSLLYKSGAPKSITSVNNVIDIPAARRSDANYLPWGRAFVNDENVATTINVVDDTATLGVVTGADAYQVLWYPQFQVYTIDGINEEYDEFQADTAWSLTVRQI